MDEELRRVGLPGVDESPWGTHFCLFYETKKGLTQLLVPYFKTGLGNNEFCLWVTSAPMVEKDARQAMTKAVPQFDRYVQDGQIVFVPNTEWYPKGKKFNIRRASQRWIEKLDQALVRGYDGMRGTGDVTDIIASHEKSNWDDFAEYEHALDRSFKNYKILLLCTYALDQCAAKTVIDVVRHHQFAVVERMGKWKGVEIAELKRKMAECMTLSEAALHVLSEREREVFQFVAHGYTNQEIADRLKLSVKTVETYRGRLMEKLNLRSRADIVRFALEAGVLTPGEKSRKAP